MMLRRNVTVWACLAAAGLANAQDPAWVGTGWQDHATKPDAFAVLDGSLVAAGLSATGWSSVMRWVGDGWEPLGTPLQGTARTAITADLGAGEALYVGGSLRLGDQAHAGVWVFDGAGWSTVGGAFDGSVRALAVFDDGSGPALYAAGSFVSVGGQPAANIARWDGSAWTPLGAGVTGAVEALAVFEDGSGPALYAAGGFTEAGGLPAGRVASWDGAAWSPAGAGVDATVQALAVYDDGAGPALYAGGRFQTAEGAPATALARWDGASWEGVIDPALQPTNDVSALLVTDEASPSLVVGIGRIGTAHAVARFDGVRFTGVPAPVTNGVPYPVTAMAWWDGDLYAADHKVWLPDCGTETEAFTGVARLTTGGRCAGDFNCDGTLDAADLVAMLDFGPGDWTDLNRDLRFDFFDVAELVRRLGEGCAVVH